MRNTRPITFSKLPAAIRGGLLAMLVLSANALAATGDPVDADAQATPPAADAQPGDKTEKSEENNKPSLMGTVQVIGYRTSAATSATGVVTEIINTPISISALNSQFLEDTASSQLMQAIGALTGVTGQNNSGEVGTNFGVRGYAVTPQIDGFDTLSTASGLGSSAGVDRIEVLKGPSAVFNGNVPPGGSINIIYKKPSFTPQTYFQGEYGSWAYRSGEFFSTGPVGDQFAYLVDVYAKNARGWVDWTGQNERTYILGLTWRPIADLSINFNYRNIKDKDQLSTLPVSHQGFIGSGAPQDTYLDDWVARNYGANEPPQTITAEQYLPRGARYNVLGPQNSNTELSRFWSTEINYTINDHVQIRDSFGHVDFKWAVLALLQSGAKVLGPDGNVSTYGLVSGFLDANEGGSGWENKLEAAFTFDTGPISHSLLLGYQASYSKLDYFRAWVDPLAPVNAAGQPWNFFRDGPLMLQDEANAWRAIFPIPNLINTSDTGHANTHAYYAAEQMSMFEDRLHVLLGLRHTRTAGEVVQGVESPSSETTPQIGILGKPFGPDSFFADTAFFANYSKSFTPSGIIEPGTNELVPPQKGTGKEFGVKTAWLNGAVTSTFSVFRDDLSNIATPDYSHMGENGGLVEYNLGGVGRAQGFEGEVTWLPSENWQLSANFTDLAVAKYLAYPGVPQQTGLRFPSAPRQAANLTAKYMFKQGPLQGLSLGGWLHAQTSTRGVLAADWHYDVHIPGLAQVSAFAGYEWNHLNFLFNIDNLTDRRGYVMNNAFQPQSPRAYFLTVKYKL
ncbi:MAG: TonB-dependent receptor plug domain-containing protein [Rudaea sp.]|uniref:TonB-dependent siderophore receptor n=1 Tax=Rudaea sp. TaxID=2136325 RepID=UPI0039E2CB76